MHARSHVEQMFLCVYCGKDLFIVFGKTDPKKYDIPTWPFCGPPHEEDIDRLLSEFFSRVTVTRVRDLGENTYECHIGKDWVLKPSGYAVFVNRNNVDGFDLTERAKNALPC